jgi:hypothetical protein
MNFADISIKSGLDAESYKSAAVIYSACIIAEAIRNELDSTDK